MDKGIFGRNLLALSLHNPSLASRLSGASTAMGRYRFLESRSGEIVPVLADSGHPLHSTVDPGKEALRLISTVMDDGAGYMVFLGLGGGFAPQAALEQGVCRALVIDFDIDGIAELFSSREYIKLLNDPRFTLLIDPSNDEIKKTILEQYRPVLCGGARTIPLRARTANDSRFDAAASAIQEAFENVTADYSVQAHFGFRWFSNIIRNLKAAEAMPEFFFTNKNISEAAIVAAGPSLDQQMPVLAEYRARRAFIISSDTALPALLHHGIDPDAVVSIDCQHISYYHFLGGNARNIPLVLDIASPPMLSRLSPSPLFFSSGHPLALYISQHWRPLPTLDVSGGNVTYACLSLAESLRAERITLFGADFSYIRSRTYARGTYIHPFFAKKQNRFSPLEALFSAFLYRSPFLPSENKDSYYETSSLRFYRKKLEEKASMMDAEIIAAKGDGAPISLTGKKPHNTKGGKPSPLAVGRARMKSGEFLEQYRNKIAALPSAKLPTARSPAINGNVNYIYNLSAEDRQIFTTLLPLAAAIKHRNPALVAGDLIEEVKRRCVEEIDRVCQNSMDCHASPSNV